MSSPLPTRQRPSIFISYARADGSALAERLRVDLQKAGYEVYLDTAIKAGSNWSVDVDLALLKSDVMLALLSNGSYLSDFCRGEQYVFVKNKKPLFPILVHKDPNVPSYIQIRKYLDFSNVAQYPACFSQLLKVLQEDNDEAQMFRASSTSVRPVNTAPPLPGRFVPRDEEFESLRRAVLDEATTRNVALTGLQGMGGIGKSVLAAALCADPLVQSAFPEGIAWVNIGRTPGNLLEPLRAIAAALGDSSETYTSLSVAITRLRAFLADRAVLIVLDDVWETEHLEPFLVGAPRVRILFTTRNAGISLALGSTEVRLGTMQTAEAVKLLQEWSGRDEPALEAIVQRLGNHPLAIKIAGARMREGMTGEEWLATFKSIGQIKQIGRSLRPEDNLQVSLELSFKDLSPEQRGLYDGLGIFPEDVWIPAQTIVKLWQGLVPSLKEAAAREFLNELWHLALLERRQEDQSFRLHDLLRDLAREILGDRLPATHDALLRAYNPSSRPWHTIADPYLYTHLVSHLLAAGRSRELEALFADDGWMLGRYKAAGYIWSGVIEDLKVVWQEGAQREVLREIESGAPPKALARCFRYALIRATINSLAIHYPAELVARAVELGEWTPQRAIGLASQSPDPAHRAGMFAAIATTGKLEPLELVKVVRLGLNAAFSNDYKRLTGNTGVVVRLLDALDKPHREVFSVKWPVLLSPSLRESDSRAQIVSWMIDNLPSDQRERFVETELLQELSLWKKDRKAHLMPLSSHAISPEVLVALAPVMTEVQIKLVLEEMLFFSFSGIVVLGRARKVQEALGQLTSRLSKAQLERTLKVVESQTADPAAQAQLFAAIASKLDEPWRTKLLVRALGMVENVPDDFFSSKTGVLRSIAPFLTEELLPSALEMALAMETDSEKSYALIALKDRLSGELLKIATQAARELENPISRCGALTALASRWGPPHQERLAEEALGIARGLDDERRLNALIRLAPLVAAESVSQIPSMASAFRKKGMASYLLESWASRMESPELRAALDEVGTIGGERQYVGALVALSRFLGGAHLDHAREVALRIRYDGQRTEALADVLPHLRGDEALRVAEVAVESALAAIPEANHHYSTDAESIHPEPLKALERMSPCLKEAHLSRVVDWITQLTSWPEQANVLSAIAPCLSGNMLQRSLSLINKFEMPWAVDNVLARVAPRLGGSLRKEVIAHVLEMARLYGGGGPGSISFKGKALAVYAPDIEEKQLKQALRDMSHVLSDGYPETLATLATRVPQSFRERLVAHALNRSLAWQQKYSANVEALKILVPALTERQRAECFGQIMRKPVENSQCETIVVMAPYLGPALRQRALEIAQNFKNGLRRAKALVALLPFSSDAKALRRLVLQSIVDYLWATSDAKRDALLLVCTEESLFNAKFLPQEVLAEMAAHIIDLHSKWRWPH
jgi:hypothetical protein